jgi:hypothetical protein
LIGEFINGDIGSVSMWFNMYVSPYSLTLLYFEADSNNRLLIYHHGGRNEFTMEHKGGGTERAIIDTTTVEGNGWHNFVYTWDTSADASVLYLDGSSVGTGQAADFTGTVDKVSIGYRYNSGMYFSGSISEVAFWDTALTSGEAAEIYNKGANYTRNNLSSDLRTDSTYYTSSGDLVGYWWMGDGDTYPTITDNSSGSWGYGSGSDGTMTNMTSGDIVTSLPLPYPQLPELLSVIVG